MWQQVEINWMKKTPLQFFKVETDDHGITTVIFDRPPVNAVSIDVLREFRLLTDSIRESDETRVVILTAPPETKAWCAGADVNEFVPLDYDGRMERFARINESLPHFQALDRPVIAAINSHAIGVGFVIATYCDIRVGSEEAFISCPEIDRGTLAGSIFLTRIGMPHGKVREMIYTGRRFMAAELRHTGFFEYIVPKDQVMPKALEIAELIAKKPLAALKANKTATHLAETMTWSEAYRMTQEESAKLTVTEDAKEGIRAFLEKREPKYRDK